jgi:hypothetical protein
MAEIRLEGFVPEQEPMRLLFLTSGAWVCIIKHSLSILTFAKNQLSKNIVLPNKLHRTAYEW